MRGACNFGVFHTGFSKARQFFCSVEAPFSCPAIYLPDAARSFGQDLARQRQPQSGVVLTEASTASRSNVVGFCPGRVMVLSVAC